MYTFINKILLKHTQSFFENFINIRRFFIRNRKTFKLYQLFYHTFKHCNISNYILHIFSVRIIFR